MSVNIDPPGHNESACRVDLTITATDAGANGRDLVTVNCDVSRTLRLACTVNDGTIANYNIWHRLIPSNRVRVAIKKWVVPPVCCVESV
jgi:hypothetical protein